ncbi:YbbR-like domain-containing protein [Cochleicola gelatinilyticus]|uniref:YbbR-like domain-containing protein n=1 Tax=Cochleicola gelatinilyticus TaxID=1763537 RepID=A0A167HER4_9FLAO|nr:hypothetical protein [Cochleicola gelatinilyticus]OAB78530.1 hypothetical protein ULVI_08020 [Cochleicola gelatinilyticus]
MSKISFPALKKSKIKSFLLFLLLAMLFWTLTKFSKEYTATVTAKVDYYNPPNNTSLSKDHPNEVSFDLTGNGFGFLFYKFKNPEVRIDLSEYFKEGASEIVIPKSELIKLTTAQLKQSIAVKNISPEQLHIPLDDIVSKKVPVIARATISFENGYQALDSLHSVPDSVMVSGPSKYVNVLDSIVTENRSFNKVQDNISADVSLVVADSLTLRLSPKKVRIAITVDEFAEKQISVPIEVINIPDGTTIKLIPKMITVTFNASVQNFKTISRDSLRIICDFKERNSEENFMIPKLIKSPKGIVNAEFSTKKIDYLIFK